MNPHKNFSYDQARESLRELLFQIADVKVKKVKKATYKGPEIKCGQLLATAGDIQDMFTPESIEYEQERKRDFIDMFINSVFRLGYSVGYESAFEKVIEAREQTDRIQEIFLNRGK